MIYLETSAAFELLSRESGVERVEELITSEMGLLSSRATFDRELADAAQRYGLRISPGCV